MSALAANSFYRKVERMGAVSCENGVFRLCAEKVGSLFAGGINSLGCFY